MNSMQFNSFSEKYVHGRLTNAIKEYYVPREGFLPWNLRLIEGREIQIYSNDRARIYRPDFALLVDGNLRAVFEVVGNLTPNYLLEIYWRFGKGSIENEDIKFFVITDGERFYVYSRENGASPIQIEFSDLLGTLLEIPASLAKENAQEYVIRQYVHLYEKLCKLANKQPDGKYIEKCKANIQSKPGGAVYAFRDSEENLEREIWELVLPRYEEKYVARYIPLNTLMNIFEYGTIRMVGIMGMNDPSEMNDYSITMEANRIDVGRMSPEAISELNRTYITSCMYHSKVDDLTAWRLYGDDSKGVCIVLKVNEIHHDKDSILRLRPVSYSKRINSEISATEHQSLKNIANFQLKLAKKNFRFDLSEFSIWKRFFKSGDYEIEKEVRLLHSHNGSTIEPKKRGWFLTQPDQILTPWADFPLNSPQFPVEIVEIILGPNCPEKDVNLRQVEFLAKECQSRFQEGNGNRFLGKEDIKVRASDLTNRYRKK